MTKIPPISQKSPNMLKNHKIPPKPKKWPKYPKNLKNDQNAPQNLKKNVQNITETQKMTKIPSKPKND